MCGSKSRARRCEREVKTNQGYNYNNISSLLNHLVPPSTPLIRQGQCQQQCQHQRCGYACDHTQAHQSSGIVSLVNAINDLAISEFSHENSNINSNANTDVALNANRNRNGDISAFNEKQIPYTTSTINEPGHKSLPTNNAITLSSPPEYSEFPPSASNISTSISSGISPPIYAHYNSQPTSPFYLDLLRSSLSLLLQSHKNGNMSKYQLRRSIRRLMNDIYEEEIEKREQMTRRKLRCKEKCEVWREIKVVRDGKL